MKILELIQMIKSIYFSKVVAVMVVEAVVIDLAVAIETEDVAADFEVKRDETIKLKTFYR